MCRLGSVRKMSHADFPPVADRGKRLLARWCPLVIRVDFARSPRARRAAEHDKSPRGACVGRCRLLLLGPSVTHEQVTSPPTPASAPMAGAVQSSLDSGECRVARPDREVTAAAILMRPGQRAHARTSSRNTRQISDATGPPRSPGQLRPRSCAWAAGRVAALSGDSGTIACLAAKAGARTMVPGKCARARYEPDQTLHQLVPRVPDRHGAVAPGPLEAQLEAAVFDLGQAIAGDGECGPSSVPFARVGRGRWWRSEWQPGGCSPRPGHGARSAAMSRASAVRTRTVNAAGGGAQFRQGAPVSRPLTEAWLDGSSFKGALEMHRAVSHGSRAGVWHRSR